MKQPKHFCIHFTVSLELYEEVVPPLSEPTSPSLFLAPFFCQLHLLTSLVHTLTGCKGLHFSLCQLPYTSLSYWSQKHHENVEHISIQYYHLCLASVIMHSEAISYAVFLGNTQIGTWWTAYRRMFVSLLRKWPSKELIRAKLSFSILTMQLKKVIKYYPWG